MSDFLAAAAYVAKKVFLSKSMYTLMLSVAGLSGLCYFAVLGYFGEKYYLVDWQWSLVENLRVINQYTILTPVLLPLLYVLAEYRDLWLQGIATRGLQAQLHRSGDLENTLKKIITVGGTPEYHKNNLKIFLKVCFIQLGLNGWNTTVIEAHIREQLPNVKILRLKVKNRFTDIHLLFTVGEKTWAYYPQSDWLEKVE